MTLYTVEATTAPIVNDDWKALSSVLDTVPGSVLLRDPQSPALLIPVEAETPMRAAIFAEGLSKVVGFTIVSGEVYETPDADEFEPDETPQTTDVVNAVSQWMDSVTEPQARLADDGKLEYA